MFGFYFFKKEQLKARATSEPSSGVAQKTRKKELTRFGIHLERAASAQPWHGSAAGAFHFLRGRSEVGATQPPPAAIPQPPMAARPKPGNAAARSTTNSSPPAGIDSPTNPAPAPKKGCLSQRGGGKKTTVRLTGVLAVEPFCDVRGGHGPFMFSQ